MKSFGCVVRAGAALGFIVGVAAGEPLVFVESTVANQGALGLAAADMDGDGDVDIVAALTGSGIDWFENDGDASPSFISQFVAGAFGVRALVAVDVTHDGNIDIVSASDSGVRRHYNNGFVPPNFSTNQLGGGMSAQHIAAGDIDRDGALDVVTAHGPLNEVAWYRNNGGMSPNFTRMPLGGATAMPTAVALGDMDRDGDLDIVCVSQNDGRLSWFEHSGSPSPFFTFQSITTGLTAVRTVGVGDLDGDGDLDIVAASDTAGGTWIYLNNGAADPVFALQQIVPFTAEELQVVDLDRDGDLDILLARLTANAVAWLDNDGAPSPGFTARTLMTGGGPHAAIAAPINGDGVLDIVVALSTGGRIALLLGSRCDGDLNGDGVVNSADLPLMLGQWGACP